MQGVRSRDLRQKR